MQKILDTVLKSDRNYVRGTDFYDLASVELRKIKNDDGGYISRILFRNITVNLCYLTLSKPAQEVLIGSGVFSTSDDSEIQFWLVDTGRNITERMPFDESAINKSTYLDKKKQLALVLKQEKFSPIENIVTLTKFLNNKLMPDVNGKWLFAQLDLVKPLSEDTTNISVLLKNAIPGRFSICQVLMDEDIVGEIKFIVGKV